MKREEGSSSLHPGELELVRYLQGSLAPGHATAVFAHCVLCPVCRRRLEARLEPRVVNR